MAWFFYLLATHPDVMKKVREEILAKFGKTGDPTYEELDTIELLNASLLETLRLYPSAGFMKRPNTNIEIGGYIVPKYCEILFLPFIVQRDERYWGPDANEFRPERFLNLGYDKHSAETVSSRTDSLQSRIARISKDHAFFPFR